MPPQRTGCCRAGKAIIPHHTQKLPATWLHSKVFSDKQGQGTTQITNLWEQWAAFKAVRQLSFAINHITPMFLVTASEARGKHIKHWRPPAVYLQLYTLHPSLYFIIWEYIYYIFFCVPIWKIKMPSEMNCFSPAYLRQTLKQTNSEGWF